LPTIFSIYGNNSDSFELPPSGRIKIPPLCMPKKIIRKNESKIKDDEALKSKISPSQAGLKGKRVIACRNFLTLHPHPALSPQGRGSIFVNVPIPS
jgi:hypothetical protein